jgi:hypothetical protein
MEKIAKKLQKSRKNCKKCTKIVAKTQTNCRKRRRQIVENGADQVDLVEVGDFIRVLTKVRQTGVFDELGSLTNWGVQQTGVRRNVVRRTGDLTGVRRTGTGVRQTGVRRIAVEPKWCGRKTQFLRYTAKNSANFQFP